MDISTIPRTFWHAISVSLIVFTVGFLFIAYKSTSISIEIADTKIALTQTALELEQASSALQSNVEEIKKTQQGLQSSGFTRDLFGTDPSNDCSGLDPAAKDHCEALKSLEDVQAEIRQVGKNAIDAVTKLNAKDN